jgi:CheY-like chemotaxis protein
VLVVDDNEDARTLVADALRLAGHEVQAASDGMSALALVETFGPEVAVLDVGLPGMDGLELAEHLRTTLGERAPRLIAMTGYGRDHDRARSSRAGFQTHLVKPVDIEALLGSVDAEGSASANHEP